MRPAEPDGDEATKNRAQQNEGARLRYNSSCTQLATKVQRQDVSVGVPVHHVHASSGGKNIVREIAVDVGVGETKRETLGRKRVSILRFRDGI